jgi:hypothetical protein
MTGGLSSQRPAPLTGKKLACTGLQQYDSAMELAVVAVITALWALGALVPTEHAFPQEIAALKKQQRFHWPYSHGPIKMLHRIWATWHVHRVSPEAGVLRQHFEVLQGEPPYYSTRTL